MRKFNLNTKNLDNLLVHLTELGAPGCSMIVFQDHEIIYKGKAGYNDTETKTPISYDNIANIYSCSKVITCTAMLKLIGEGKVLLNDPLYKYIPEFKDVKVRHLKTNREYEFRAPKKPITILDLFTMSAGLNYDLNSAPIKEIREKYNGACPTVETMSALAKAPLEFDPGEHYRYSLCHDMLGAVIEVVSGISFGEYLKKNIFDPLEMKDTCFVLDESKKDRLMCQYRYNPELGKAEKITTACAYKLGAGYESGGAGILSTLEDYATFIDALACGGVGRTGARIISTEMLELMRENQFRDPVRTAEFAHPGYGYGLGVRTHFDRGLSLRPCPVGEFGWGGAAGAQMIIDPVNHLSMFYLQHMLGTPYTPAERIVNAIYS